MTVDMITVRARRAIRSVRGEDASGVALDRLVEQPGLESRTQVDAAADFAAAKEWLAFGDEAAHLALLLDRGS